MNKEFIKSMWNNSSNEDNLLEVQKFWDLRAEEFDELSENDSESMDVIQYLSGKNFLDESYNVLDIGCGAGRYSLKLADETASVTGIDISPKMIKCANKNADKHNLKNINFQIQSWEKTDIEEQGWNEKFDLVFASMTPAISSYESLMKMINASKKYGFMSNFVYRKDSVREGIFKFILNEEYPDNNPGSIYYAFNLLWSMGIYPEIIYKNVEWTKIFTKEKAIEMYSMKLKRNLNEGNSLKDKVSEYIEKISIDGIVEEKIKAKIAWMTWEV